MADILVVEDDPVMRGLLQEMLEGDEHLVLAAGDGCEALAFCRAAVFDLVVADLVMPGLDGAELARRLWERDHAGPPVVIVSGADDKRERLSATLGDSPGVAAVVAKPFSVSEFRWTVRAVLGSHPGPLEPDKM